LIEQIEFVEGAIEDPAAVAGAVGESEAIVQLRRLRRMWIVRISGPEAFIVTKHPGQPTCCS